jgi:hypothetical protein
MTKRERDLKRLLSLVTEHANARLEAMRVTRRVHYRAIFVRQDGISRAMYLAATLSDNASTLKNTLPRPDGCCEGSHDAE